MVSDVTMGSIQRECIHGAPGASLYVSAWMSAPLTGVCGWPNVPA
jgi:hypothetical protein